MKDFSNASFSPDIIEIMNDVMETAVATLPRPVSSAHVQAIAEGRERRRERYCNVAKIGAARTASLAARLGLNWASGRTPYFGDATFFATFFRRPGPRPQKL
jgi:hypothetical protein